MRLAVTRTAVILTLAFVATGLPALSASASSSTGTSATYTCGVNASKVGISSTSTGRVNHAASGIVLNSWYDTKSTSHYSKTGEHSVNGWKVYLTGRGGDITYGNAVCY